MGRNFFLGAHGLDPGHAPFRSLRLGAGPTNRDMANELQRAIDLQFMNRERNDALPEAFRLNYLRDIAPVDQLIEDQLPYITELEEDPDLWGEEADRVRRNLIMNTTALARSVEGRLREQESKAAAVGVKMAPPPPTAASPSVAKAGTVSGGAILAAIGVAAFATAYFLSEDSWSIWPWKKSSYQPVPSSEGN